MNFFKRANSVDSKKELSQERQIELLRETVATQNKLIEELVKSKDPKRYQQLDRNQTKKETSSRNLGPCTSRQAMEDGELSDSTVVGPDDKNSGMKRWNNYDKKLFFELNKGEMSFDFEEKAENHNPVSPRIDSEEDYEYEDEDYYDFHRHVIPSPRRDFPYSEDQVRSKNTKSTKSSSPQPLRHQTMFSNQLERNMPSQARKEPEDDIVSIDGKLFRMSPLRNEACSQYTKLKVNRQDSTVNRQNLGNKSRLERDASIENTLRPKEIRNQMIIGNKSTRITDKFTHLEFPRQYEETLNKLVGSRANEKSLTFFRGKPSDNLDEWFFTMERFFKKGGIPAHEQVDYAVDYLKDNGLTTYRSFDERELTSWSKFKRMMNDCYQPKNLQKALRKQLSDLKQEGSIQDYIHDFDRIMNQVREMSEVDKIDRFIDGLHPRTKNKVAFEEPMTLGDAKTLAQRVDIYFNQNNITRNEETNKVDKTNRVRNNNFTDRYQNKKNLCRNCGENWEKCHRCNKHMEIDQKTHKKMHKTLNSNKKQTKLRTTIQIRQRTPTIIIQIINKAKFITPN